MKRDINGTKTKGLDDGIDRNKLEGVSDLESEVVCSLYACVRWDFVESEGVTDQVRDLYIKAGGGHRIYIETRVMQREGSSLVDVGRLGCRRRMSLATKSKLGGRMVNKARVLERLEVEQAKWEGQRVFRMRSPASR